MRIVSIVAVIAALVLAPCGDVAQQPAKPADSQASSAGAPPPAHDPGTYSLSVTTRLLNVTAVVRDSHGAIVRNLTKDDFILREDGKVKPIKYFSVDNDLPLTLGLMVDTSLSQRSYAAQERNASRLFLHRLITRSTDRAFVERFDYRALILAPLTSNLTRLDLGLGDLLNAPGTDQPSGTVLWDAIIATADQIIGKEPGRRAIVIMTDGEDFGSKSQLIDAVRFTSFYELPVYSILYTEKPVGFLGPMDPQVRAQFTAAGPLGMEILSQATGGRTFVVTPASPVDTIFATIEEDLRSQYRFSITPANTPSGTHHTLELKIKKGHYTIQTQTGYYTAPASSSEPASTSPPPDLK